MKTKNNILPAKTTMFASRGAHLLGLSVALVAGLLACGLIYPSIASATDSVVLHLIANGSDGLNQDRTQTSSGARLTDSVGASAWVSGSVSAGLGGIYLDATSHYMSTWSSGCQPIFVGYGTVSLGTTYWDRQLTITGTDPALDGTNGTVQIDYHITGSIRDSGNNTNNHVFVYGGYAPIFRAGEFNGALPDSFPATRTSNQSPVTFSSGGMIAVDHGQVESYTQGQGTVACVSGSWISTLNVSLRQGVMRVRDANGNFVTFNSSSSTGTARAQNIPSGSLYNSFNLTNNVGYQTNLILRDGTTSANQYVQAAFTAALPSRGPTMVSDVVDFLGTQTDPIVIQMSYDPAAASTAFGGEAGLRLAWLNGAASQQWVNAVRGNSGGTAQFFARAYNPATDFQLGNYGVDTVAKTVWAVVNHNSQFGVTVPFELATVVSEKTHGAAGTFDINMPLTGTPGVECRTGGAGGNHTLVFTFSSDIVSGDANVTSGTGSVSGSPTFAANTMTVNLAGVTDAQRVAVTLSNVTSSSAQVLPDTAFTVGFLLGDTTGNGAVTASDIGQTKSQSGVPVTAANFRNDVNVSGTINASDIGQVKASAGHSLP